MIKILNVFLHDNLIGKINLLPGENTIFTFEDDYIQNPNRAILSQSFIDKNLQLITNIKSFRSRLDPFFSNLLPEGALRSYLATRHRVNPTKEFEFLEVLGSDLPGGLVITNSNKISQNGKVIPNIATAYTKNAAYHFSLAGVQLKFSAINKKHNKLTIPINGETGNWIVKLPSINFPQIAENEYLTMSLAKNIGINVPEFKLIHIKDLNGLPASMNEFNENLAFAIKRFDRNYNNQKVHIEDFAQVYGLYPEQKYNKVSYTNIAALIWVVCQEQDLIEYIRRLVFSILIGNGDMHLKNWSFIYTNQHKPQLSPAYDLISTVPYLHEDNLALTLVNTKKMQLCNIKIFQKLIEKAKLPQQLVLSTVKETSVASKDYWSTMKKHSNLNPKIITAIDKHIANIPL